ncbi:NADP-dependent oxidoreductase [Micromonospora sp. NPDC048999]|uniref:NADP-dependent oxidoreductase n=1 Tax=Micromonospora sp. NPDC048999 TaxID=3155391 RepID=UPI0033F78C5A
MKAVQFADYGGPEVLRPVEVPEPHAGPGQIRVAVRAAGVNPMDWKVRSGAMRQMMPLTLPAIPGSDVAGVVDEVGAGVTGVEVGDEVFGFATADGYAEYAVLEHFVAKPPTMSWEEAAGVPVVAETAVRSLDLLGVREGHVLLVNGASGGVGLTAAQLARARGATVLGTSSPANHDFLRGLGVIPTSYGAGLVERVRKLAPDGVDAALDTAGKGAIPDLIAITGTPERVLTISDPDAPGHGVRMTTGAEGRSYQALAEVARLFERGEFDLPVARTFDLEQAAEAQEISQGGHVRGKLVLRVA